MPSSELQKRPTSEVDPADEPSAEWGWHGTLPRGARIAGWAAAILCFAFFIGNQVGHVEDIYLAITGVVLIILQIRSMVKRRNAWRR